VTFQAVLRLNTGATAGDIIVNCPDLLTGDANDGGASATVGLRSPSGTTLIAGFNGSNPAMVGDQKAIQFSVPHVLSINRASANPIPLGNADFLVVYSHTMNTAGIDPTDFTVTTTGATVASVSQILATTDPKVVDVRVTTSGGGGTVKLNQIDDDTIMSIAGAHLGGLGAGNGGFTAGQTYNVLSPTAVTLTDNGPNASIVGQAVSLSGSVSPSVPNGETITLEDASNGNAVVATTATTGGAFSFSVSSLSVGTHNLFAVYGGDSTYAGSQSSQVSQVVNSAPPPSVTAVVINQDIAALYNAAGQPAAGVQRSMVNDIVYTFSEAVNITAANVDPNVFAIAVASGWSGTVPTLSWAPVAGSGNTQWAVSFSGNGVNSGSIANGAYTITVNHPLAITAVSDSQALSLAGSGIGSAAQSFYRLYGDINGDEVVNAIDNLKFKQALTTYNAAFDVNNDGLVNASDNIQFKNDLVVNFSGFTATI
jgi:Bacterial Ig-like domain (group 3)/Dockerin type I domain